VSGTSGGWRGTGHEAHLHLDPHDDALVRAAHARAADAGRTLDTKLKDLEAATASFGGKLEGLDYSVKGLDSLRRKVASGVEKGEDASTVVAGTRDMNRYTICFPAESYSEGVAAGFNRLQELGLSPYNPEKTHKNAWNDPSYKGINTSWQDQDTGQVVEIQFHTPESFKAKSDNHALYELSRSGSLDRREMAAADWLQAQRYENVAVPPGHDMTVPAKPSRELEDFPPEALEQVRAKEAELKQSQASESPADEQPGSDPPPSADANDAAKEAESAQDAAGEGAETGESEDVHPQPVDNGVAEPREAEATADEQDPGDEADTEEPDAKQTGRGPEAEDAEGQDTGASYDDHEDDQLARIAAANAQQEGGDRDDYGDTSFTTANRERGGVGD
jgi:hypothetical protein